MAKIMRFEDERGTDHKTSYWNIGSVTINPVR